MTVKNAVSFCPRCAKTFTCGALAGQPTCWCANLPVLPSAEKTALSCYCPVCLRELLATPLDSLAPN